MATHSSILAWKIPWARGAWSSWSCKRVGHNLVTKQQCFLALLSQASYCILRIPKNFILTIHLGFTHELCISTLQANHFLKYVNHSFSLWVGIILQVLSIKVILEILKLKCINSKEFVHNSTIYLAVKLGLEHTFCPPLPSTKESVHCFSRHWLLTRASRLPSF